MKKIVTLLVSISILFGMLGFAAAEGETEIEINEGMVAAYYYSLDMGDNGHIVKMNSTNPADQINSKFVFINTRLPGEEIAVMIRISETELICWQKPLTKENLDLALVVLHKEAPYCRTEVLIEGEPEMKAEYVKDSDSSLSFYEFKEMSKMYLYSTRNGRIAEEEPSGDPVLSLFPEVRWGMTPEATLAAYGQDTFPEAERKDGGDMVAHPTILGQEEVIHFIYLNGKLWDITMIGRKDIPKIADQLTETYNTLYGQAKRGIYSNVLNGDYSESDTADTSFWIFNRTAILMPDSRAWVLYRPLY